VLVTNIATKQETLVLVADSPSALGLPDGESVLTLGEDAARTIGVTETTAVKAEVVGLDGNIPVGRFTTLLRSNPAAETVGAREVSNADKSLMFASINSYTSKGEIVKPQGFGVQVGSYNQLATALEKAQKFEGLQFKQVVIQTGWTKGEKVYRVLVGEFPTKEASADLVTLLKGMGEQAFAREHFVN
jgi:rare lipoprotein A